MLAVVLVTLASVLYCFYVCLRSWNRRSTQGKTIPMPKGWPILGNAPQLGADTMHNDCTRIAAEMGDVYQLKLFNRYMVVANTADSAREALVKNSSHWSGRIVSYRSELATGFHSLFTTSQLPYLKKVKKTASGGLSVYGSADQAIENHLVDCVEDFLGDLQLKVGSAFNMRTDIDAVVRRMVATMLLGTEVDKDSPLPQLIGQYGQSYKKSLALTPAGLLLDNVPVSRLFKNPAYDNIMEAVSCRNRIWDEFIQPNSDEIERGFAARVLPLLGQKFGEKDADVVNNVQVRNLMGDLFFGGTVTSTDSLYAFVKMLCEFPEVQEKMADEILRELGRDVLVRVSDKLRLPYCRAFLYEALRYSSTVPLSIPRRATRDTELYGMKVPKEHCLLANIWAIHHDERIWSQPYSFQPERFLTKDGDLVAPDHPNRKNIFIFGAGSRSCLGQNVAMDNLFLVIANLVGRFQVSPQGGVRGKDADPYRWKVEGITLQVPPFQVEVRPRQNGYCLWMKSVGEVNMKKK